MDVFEPNTQSMRLASALLAGIRHAPKTGPFTG
jgi:hypothetical protein